MNTPHASLNRLLPLLCLLLTWGTILAQEDTQPVKSPGIDATSSSNEPLEQRIRELEDRVLELQEQLSGGLLESKDFEDKLEAKIEEELEKGYSRGILTFKGAELRLGGKLEINYVDTQSESDPVLGTTDNPDPHLRLDRIRLEPTLDIGKKMEINAQLDLLPDDGSTLLKEATFVWEFQADDYWKDLWWIKARTQIGLDDRFIHLGPKTRVTETYPIIGTAFWRDEEIALLWEGTLGKKRGAPQKKKKRTSGEMASVPRDEKTNSTTYDPFDFTNNMGALTLFFSIGDGYTLNDKSINKDDGDLQKVMQDDRETEDNLSLRSLGFGLGYERDFNWLGEISVLGFFYEDELSDESLQFLQTELSPKDGSGNPIGSLATSDRDYVKRAGVGVAYHLEGYHILDNWMDTWPGDGLYVNFQWIDAQEGKLNRDGWYVQASYRFSFPQPLVNERYFRYFQPVVRYGEYRVRWTHHPELPLTWNRNQVFLGNVLGITDRMLMKFEYAIFNETTGGGDVDNNEFLVQLLLEF